jgi:hypothetical protein
MLRNNCIVPITVTQRSKARNAFARLNTEIMGSNPIRGMDICFYSVFDLPIVYKIYNSELINYEWEQTRESERGRRIRELYCALLSCRADHSGRAV